MTLQNNQAISLSDALTFYFSNLKEEGKGEVQQELSKFVRWCGRDRLLSKLTPPLMGEYSDFLAASGTTPDAARRLEIIKAFLSFVGKQGMLTQNLAQHIRARRRKSRVKARYTGEACSDIKLTAEGYAQLQAELEVKKEEQVRTAVEIRRAAADKDVRENAPLEAAREQQGHIEGRIREIEATLAVAILISEEGQTIDTPTVQLGRRVTIRHVATGQEMTYTLVSSSEANPLEGKISVASPLGKALIDRFPKQDVEVATPGGAQRYLIIDVSS